MCDCAGFSGASACDYTDWSARSKGNCALIVIKCGENFFGANIAGRTI
jgi:surfactin synthase thioesterase subunit